MPDLKGYAGVCKRCSAPHIRYGEIPRSCVTCGSNIEFHGQITKLGMLLPGLYHAVKDRRYFKRTNWEIYADDPKPVGDVINLVQLRRIGKTQTLAGVHESYSGTHLDEFIGNPKVAIRWFIINHPIDLEGA